MTIMPTWPYRGGANGLDVGSDNSADDAERPKNVTLRPERNERRFHMRLKELLMLSCFASLTIFSAASISKAQGGEKVNKPKGAGLGTVTLPTKPKEGTDAKPSYPTGDLTLPAIRNLIVSPTMTGMTLTFAARSGPMPLVEISGVAPFTDSLNHSSFHPTLYQFNPVSMKNKSTPKETAYAGGSYQLNINLSQDTKYYYIVTLPAQGSFPEYQLTGSFTTTNRKVTVNFTRIHILDDSDPSGSGELSFTFWVEGGVHGGNSRKLGDRENSLYWDSGHIENLRQMLPFVIEQAGDLLRIVVEGEDDDAGLPAGCIETQTEKDFEDLKPHKIATCGNEVNYAKREFDLSKYPGKFVSIPFTLTSMPLGPHGVTLAFDVSGYIEFRNPDVP
jgi:hypothetical protein